MDAISCNERDELYQLYLMLIGSAEAFTFLCENDSFSGSSHLVLNLLNSRGMNLSPFISVMFIVILHAYDS